MSAGAIGDVVLLKNGKVYEGTVTRRGALVIVEMKYGQIELNAADVKEIIKGKDPAKPKNDPPTTKPVTPSPKHIFQTENITRPECMAFIFMRRLASMPAGIESFNTRKQIERWRHYAHDRKRKAGAQWREPEYFQKRRLNFEKYNREVDEIAKKLRRVRGDDRRDEALRKSLKKAGAKKMLTAAEQWPDPLIRRFMTGIAYYRGGHNAQAEAAFRRCAQEAPLVAAFFQGRGKALGRLEREVDALEAYTRVIQLHPTSSQALLMLRGGMQNVPGNKTTSPVYAAALILANQYEEESSRSSSRIKSTIWMLPDKVRQSRDAALPVPSYHRLNFHQGMAVAISKNALLVDANVVKDAAEIYVYLDDDTVVRAKKRRSSRRSRSKGPKLPLEIVTVSDCELTPLAFDAKSTLSPGQDVATHSLSYFTKMGAKSSTMTTTVEKSEDGSLQLSRGLFAGDAAAPIISPAGGLIGFAPGKTDVTADDGGSNKLISAQDLAPLLERIPTVRDTSRGRGAKRTFKPKLYKKGIFIIRTVHCESLDPIDTD